MDQRKKTSRSVTRAYPPIREAVARCSTKSGADRLFEKSYEDAFWFSLVKELEHVAGSFFRESQDEDTLSLKNEYLVPFDEESAELPLD